MQDFESDRQTECPRLAAESIGLRRPAFRYSLRDPDLQFLAQFIDVRSAQENFIIRNRC
jgi:hypothetical protein